MTKRRERVAIVGAGVTRLTAARALAGGGVEVTLFDKGLRPGGRISTRTGDAGCFDHGAPGFAVQGGRIPEVTRAIGHRWRYAPHKKRARPAEIQCTALDGADEKITAQV